MQRKIVSSASIILGFLLAISISSAQSDTSGFFNSDSMLEIEVITWLDILKADCEEEIYHPAIIRYMGSEGKFTELEVEIRTRGGFRKNPDNCDFPPLKMKFGKQEKANTIFHDIKSLKLVTHCQSNKPDFEQYLFQEYLIYKTYHLLSEVSLHVRLARITYQDMDNPDDRICKYAFFLEDSEELASRTGGELIEIDAIDARKIDSDGLVRVAIFNYMIYNTDWSAPLLHNLDLISLHYLDPPVPVPHDFDWSGLVGAPYVCNVEIDETGLQPERIYKGPCLGKKEFYDAFEEFKTRKSEIIKLYSDFSLLGDSIKLNTIHMIESFFEVLDDRKAVKDEFIDKCLY